MSGFPARESKALAQVVVGPQRGVGLRLQHVLQALGTRRTGSIEVLTELANRRYGPVVRWVADPNADLVLSLLSHVSPRTIQALHSENLPAGFSLALLLYLLRRQANTGAPGIPLEDVLRQFEQTMPNLASRVRRHLDWLQDMRLVARVAEGPDGEGVFGVTAVGRGAFSLSLLARFVSESQSGIPYADEQVAAFFGLTKPDPALPPEVDTPMQEVAVASMPGDEETLAIREHVALAVMMAHSRGDGLPMTQFQDLAMAFDDDAVEDLMKRANRHYRGVARFVVTPVTGYMVALSELTDRDSPTATGTPDVQAVILMYLYYVQGSTASSGVPIGEVFEALAGVGTAGQLRYHLGQLTGHGLVSRTEASLDGSELVSLTSAGWVVFPPWLPERLPRQANTGIVPLEEVRSFYQEHVRRPQPSRHPPEQVRLF